MDEKKVTAEEKQAEAFSNVAELLERTIPKDAKKFFDDYVENMESQFIEPEDEIAVLDMSMSAASISDGWGGHYTESLPGEFTKEGLPKFKRWVLVVNRVPTDEYTHEVTIVKKKEWEQYRSEQPGSAQDWSRETTDLMLRAGGSK